VRENAYYVAAFCPAEQLETVQAKCSLEKGNGVVRVGKIFSVVAWV